MARLGVVLSLLRSAVRIRECAWTTYCSRARALSSTFLLLLAAISTSVAQGNPDPQAGILPFSTITGSKYDTINLATSNVVLTLPLRNKIGKIPFTTQIIGGGRLFQAADSNPLPSWAIDSGNFFEPVFGQALTLYFYEAYTQQCGSQAYDPVYTGFAAIDASGISHTLQASPDFYMDEYGCLGPTTATLGAQDGSGYTAFINSASLGKSVLYDRFGDNVSSAQPGTLVDPDGVTMSIPVCAGCAESNQSYTDTLGQTALTVAYTTNKVGPTQGSYTYTDVNANTQRYTVTYTDLLQASNFGCSNVTDFTSYAAIPLPTQVKAPDGGIYTISYEPTYEKSGYVTGRIAKITLPMGGYISYQYEGGANNAGISCGGSVVPTLIRTVNDGLGNNSVWTYTNNLNAWNSGPFSVGVTDPAGNLTTVTFSGSLGGYQVESQAYQGSGGTPLITTITCYNQNFANCTTTGAGPTGFAVTQTDVFTYLNGSSSASLVETKYDSYGDVTEVKKYDFGAATTLPPTKAPTVSPLSDTTTVYGTWNGTACVSMSTVNSTIGQYMFAYPCTVTTVNSAGQMVSQKRYTYNAGGHPTQTQTWVSGTTYLTSYATYNTNGTAATTTDVNGALSTYAYNGAGGCNSLLPTSVTVTGEGLPSGGLITSTQWNCNGAVVAQVSDPNSQATIYKYVNQSGTADPLWRVNSVTDPLENTRYISYYPTGPVGPYEQSSLSFGSSVDEEWQSTDGIGRPILVQKAQSPSGSYYDTVSTSYGWGTTGQQVSRSIPCSAKSAAGCPAGLTTSTADALGRPLTVTDGGGGTVSYTYVKNDVLQSIGPAPNSSKQLEYDGMGRLTSVCEITSLTGSGPCGQSNPATGFLTSYSYDPRGNLLSVSQNAQPGGTAQNRSYSYDGLSRLTSESNPESGTTNYVYDASSAPCNGGAPVTFSGDLIMSTGASGGCAVYFYDALHRVTDVGNSGQTAINSCKRFRYDNSSGYRGSTKPTGLANTLGRLIEVATDTCISQSNDALLTDEWFSYDADGHDTDVYESTPNSGGYYHTNASYFANGAVNTLSGVPGLSSWTFGVDGEGRPSTVTYGASTNWVTGTTYYPTNSQTTVSYGNGDSDVYSFDGTTGRMTGYQFTVGATPKTLAGTLGWNANWTLGSMAITDGFNSANAQNCSYGFDALSRISNVSCANSGGTNIWGQDFTFDPFGNITKTVPAGETGTSFQPTYSPSTNQYTLSGCFVTYDANGNLTNDCNNTYAWDVYGRPVTIGSKSITYDGLGREAEIASGSTYTQVLYSPIGELGLMSGQTIKNIRIPLPGGSTMEDVGSQTRILHSDWLGSSRLSTLYQNRTLAYDTAYAPYGETYVTAGSQSDVDFTGKRPDTQTGLYDFPAREYSTVGRWISPDPAGLNAVDISNPQSWNRYAYVMNNPVTLTDPLGLQSPGNGIGQCGPAGCNIPGAVNCGAPGGIPGQGGCATAGNMPSLANNLAGWDALNINWNWSSEDSIYGVIIVVKPGTGAPNNGPQLTACQQTVLNAVNNQFGTNLTANNVLPTSDPNPQPGGQVNVNFGVSSGLSAEQFNAIQAGRYAPGGFWGDLTGYGPSLHVVASASGLDPNVMAFSSSNIGGMYSVNFTAHIDSAWANNPIGALLHLFIDVFGAKSRKPCPSK